MDHDDFDQEPIRGLPELPPEGETILWQGAPSTWAMARDVFKLRWVAGYFTLVWAWRTVDLAASMPWGQAALEASFFLAMGACVCAVLIMVAWAQAQAAMYTITSQRVILRVGAALTVTMQFPYRWIGSASLVTRGDGTGTIALTTLGDTRFGYFTLWPHARPWHFAKTQPALRCVPDAARVAGILAEAAEMAASMPKVEPVRRPQAAAMAAE